MIEATSLLPPTLGPRSNPVLFGVAEALADILPPILLAPWPVEQTRADTGRADEAESPEE